MPNEHLFLQFSWFCKIGCSFLVFWGELDLSFKFDDDVLCCYRVFGVLFGDAPCLLWFGNLDGTSSQTSQVRLHSKPNWHTIIEHCGTNLRNASVQASGKSVHYGPFFFFFFFSSEWQFWRGGMRIEPSSLPEKVERELFVSFPIINDVHYVTLDFR